MNKTILCDHAIKDCVKSVREIALSDHVREFMDKRELERAELQFQKDIEVFKEQKAYLPEDVYEKAIAFIEGKLQPFYLPPEKYGELQGKMRSGKHLAPDEYFDMDKELKLFEDSVYAADSL